MVKSLEIPHFGCVAFIKFGITPIVNAVLDIPRPSISRPYTIFSRLSMHIYHSISSLLHQRPLTWLSIPHPYTQLRLILKYQKNIVTHASRTFLSSLKPSPKPCLNGLSFEPP
ncbi:hypothetical protein C0991_008712 [Blastosporella zonata]|nr:hypothetical protein C0991_008712 [Blastosporella zonata]